MKSLLRFLAFVALAAAVLGVVALWRSMATGPSAKPQKTAHAVAITLPNLAALDREFTQLVAEVMPSVVSINAVPQRTIDLQALFGGGNPRLPGQLGSGAILSEDGYIATNLHVIQNAGSAEVFLHDGRSFPAKLVGADPTLDIAILKIDADGLRPIPLGDSDSVRVGQMVFAVGNPYGLSETVTQGIISAIGRRTMETPNEFLQTDTPINPGNSGGPLIDLQGRLVGLNNHIRPMADGIGFAIPANSVRRIYEGLRSTGRVQRSWLGVNLYPYPLTEALAARIGVPVASGALVWETVPNSPAQKAGVQPRDIITSFNGRAVRDDKELWNRIVESEPGKTVTLRVLRDGKEIALPVTIEAMPVQ